MENGYAISSNGTLMIAVRSEIPQGKRHKVCLFLLPRRIPDPVVQHVVTGEQYDWWFGWHSVETARYKLWSPIAHQYSYRTPDSIDWANRTYAERYIGATSYIDEYVGNDAAKLSIQFVEPGSMGFNTSAASRLSSSASCSSVVSPQRFLAHVSFEA